MNFKIVGEISDVEIIATGSGIREVARLNKKYGYGHWRKLKGVSLVEFLNGEMELAEIHWYEAHGIGKKEMKIKHLLGD